MKIVCISLLFITLSATCFAQKSVDASQFDVAGVKLGMSMEEAKAAAIKHMNVDASALELPVHENINIITKAEEPNMFSVMIANPDGQKTIFNEKPFKEKLVVNFTPDPMANGEMRVQMISYQIPWTNDNEIAMRQAGLNKYGPASNRPEDVPPSYGMSLIWCKSPNKVNPPMGCTNSNEAILEVAGVEVTLFDGALHERFDNWWHEQKSVTPSF